MFTSLLLAVARNGSSGTSSSPFDIEPISRFPAQQDLMEWCSTMGPGTAILLMLVGVVYLMYGWTMFKGLILLNALFIGGYVGAMLGSRYGNYPLAGALLGATVAGAAT